MPPDKESRGSADADVDGVLARTITASITVMTAYNLQNNKDTLNSFVRVEFAKRSTVESPVIQDERNPRYQFPVTYELSRDTSSLCEIASKPVVLSIMEQNPKDKKTTVLAQGIVDLTRLLQGETEWTQSSPLTYISQEAAAFSAANATTGASGEPSVGTSPSIDVIIKATEPIVSISASSSSNLLSVRIAGIYSLPTEWLSLSAATHSFQANVIVPFPREDDPSQPNVLSIKRGIPRSTTEVDGDDDVKVPDVNISPMELFEVTDDAGDFLGEEGIEFRKKFEHQQAYIDFTSQLRRAFVSSPSVLKLQRSIAETPIWGIEFSAVPLNAGSNAPKAAGKPALVSDGTALRGMARVNVAQLLYPGISTIRGAYKIEMSFQNPGSNIAMTTNEAVSEKAPATPYALVEISLRQPLVPQRPMFVTREISSYIKPRQAFPRLSGSSKQAIMAFHSEIVSTVTKLSNEFKELFGASVENGTLDSESSSASIQERREKLLYHLNTSGKYFAFKERLKRTVVEIVRVKYLKTQNFTDKKELQEFLSRLYVTLVDEMHVSINQVFSVGESEVVPSPFEHDCASLLRFAEEAASLQRDKLAIKYFRERIAIVPDNSEFWADLGSFYLRINKVIDAEECFQEAIALNQFSVAPLLILGSIKIDQEKYQAAETFLTAATSSDCNNDVLSACVPWCILGLFHDARDDAASAEIAFTESRRLNATIDSMKNPSTPPKSPYLQTAIFLVSSGVLNLAERALAADLLVSGQTANRALTLGRLHMMRGNYLLAIESLKVALVLDHSNPNARAALGHCYFFLNELSEARGTYERCLLTTTEPADVYTVHLRLGQILLGEKNYTRAKVIFLSACETSPSCSSWLGVGISCFELGDFQSAEDALSEANIINNMDATVWAYLTLLCLTQGREYEAEQAHRQLIRLGFNDSVLLDEINRLGEGILPSYEPSVSSTTSTTFILPHRFDSSLVQDSSQIPTAWSD